jgi:hypothetical protein
LRLLETQTPLRERFRPVLEDLAREGLVTVTAAGGFQLTAAGRQALRATPFE